MMMLMTINNDAQHTHKTTNKKFLLISQANKYKSFKIKCKENRNAFI
jgi:hypothetical protein